MLITIGILTNKIVKIIQKINVVLERVARVFNLYCPKCNTDLEGCFPKKNKWTFILDKRLHCSKCHRGYKDKLSIFYILCYALFVFLTIQQTFLNKVLGMMFEPVIKLAVSFPQETRILVIIAFSFLVTMFILILLTVVQKIGQITLSEDESFTISAYNTASTLRKRENIIDDIKKFPLWQKVVAILCIMLLPFFVYILITLQP